MKLPFEVYLDAITEEADRLVDAAGRGLAVSVPSCPGWHVEDLVRHVSGLYVRFGRRVGVTEESAADAGAPQFEPDEDDPIAALEAAAIELVRILAAAGPDAPWLSPAGRATDVGWVARRMALETAVHRVDAELARGAANAVERELAVDGIDEVIEDRLRSRVPAADHVSLGGSLCLACSDDPAAWVVEVDRGRMRVRNGRAPANAALVAKASDVFLFTWNRVDPELLSVTGDLRVAKAWRTLPV